MTDPSERAELRRIAEAARGSEGQLETRAYVFAITFTPDRVLSLLDERVALEAEVRKLREDNAQLDAALAECNKLFPIRIQREGEP